MIFLKKKFLLIYVYLHFFISFTPVIAYEPRDYLLIEILVNNCFNKTKSCYSVLSKINTYQKKAVRNKKFSCQTRLLGLEANLIMAMNNNLKRNDAKNIIQVLRKYC